MLSQTKRSGGGRHLRSRSAHHPVPSLNFLQRTAGNRAVASLFETRIQRSPEDEKQSGEKGTPNPLLVKQFEKEIIEPAKRSVGLIRSGRAAKASTQLRVAHRRIRRLYETYEKSNPELALRFLAMHNIIVIHRQELGPRKLGKIADTVENQVLPSCERARGFVAFEPKYLEQLDMSVIEPAVRSVPLIRSGRRTKAIAELWVAQKGLRELQGTFERWLPDNALRFAALHTLIEGLRRELAPGKLGKIADSVENEVVKNLEAAKGALK